MFRRSRRMPGTKHCRRRRLALLERLEDRHLLAADLQGYVYDVEQDPLSPGDGFSVLFRVENIGTTNAGSFDVCHFLSRDETINVSDYFLGDVTIPGVTAGGTAARRVNLNLPDAGHGIYDGDSEYTIGMVVDCYGNVNETTSSNNSNRGLGLDKDSVTIQEGAGPINLRGDFFDVVPETMTRGDSFTTTFRVANTADGDAGPFKVAFYLSRDFTIDKLHDFWLEDVTVQGVNGNSTSGLHSVNLTLPGQDHSIWDAGTGYTIGMCVDDPDMIVELDENDNCNVDVDVDQDDVTIHPQAAVSVSVSPSSVPEDGPGALTYTFQRSHGDSGDLDVNFSVGGSSSFSSDFQQSGAASFSASSGTVHFSGGNIIKTVTVTPIVDNDIEPDETLVFTVTGGSRYVVGSSSSATGTILNDDDPPMVTLALTNSPMPEAAGTATVTATLSAASVEVVTVNLAFAGTATLTDDYTRTGTSITIPAGETTGMISLTAVQDALDEPDETIVVEIDSVTNGTEDGTQHVTATISDDDPGLDALADVVIDEDAGPQTVNLTGIAAGGGENQPLEVTAASSNPSLIPTPSVQYTSPNAGGSIQFTPESNQSGTSVVTVTVTDGGLDGDLATAADNGMFSQSFTVTVNPVNDNPTLDTLADVSINENAGPQTIHLTGIGAGGEESQPLRVTASSGNAALIPSPTVMYTSPNDTGSVQFTPAANATGSSVITATVTDGGLDGDLSTPSDNASFSRSFTVTVNPPADNPDQIVTPDASELTVPAGSAFSFDVSYNVSDGNIQLPQLRVRMHFDSSKLAFDPATGISDPLTIGGPTIQVQADTSNLDADAATDMLVNIFWFGITGWPDRVVPLDLFTANFTAVDVSDATTTTVNFTGEPSIGYDLITTPVNIAITPFSLDIDGDGLALAPSDGILVLRYLAEFTGDVLTANAVNPNGTRTDVAAIEAYLAENRSLMDIDGDGQVIASTDGILILRYLAEFRDDVLILNVVNPAGARTTAGEIEAYIAGLLPPPASAQGAEGRMPGGNAPGAEGENGMPQQIVTPTPAEVAALNGAAFSFTTSYDVSDGNTSLPTLHLRMHYDSSELAFALPAGITDAFNFGGPTVQLQADTSNADGDPKTDMLVNMFWFDFNGWPGQPVPLDLFTANFTVTDLGADDTTTINFTGEPSITHELATAPVIVTSNVNRPPVADDAAFAVDENATQGTAVGTVAATDPDAGQTLSYAITGGNGSGGGAFAINNSTGAITVADPLQLDRETVAQFGLTVEVTDDGTPAMSDTATVTINLNDVNEFDPALGDATFSLPENSANGTAVGTLGANDDDATHTFSYSITAGNGSGAFAIDPASGQITVADATKLDAITMPQFMLTIEVSDSGPGTPRTNTAAVTVSILDAAPVLEVLLVPVGQASPDDSTTLPTEITTVTIGLNFFIEVWIREHDQVFNGTVGGYVDVVYDTTLSDGITLIHRDFDAIPTHLSSIDDPAGRIEEFGGVTLVQGRGNAPDWARLGIIEFAATQLGMQTLRLEPGVEQFALLGNPDVIPWDQVDLSDVAEVAIVPAAQFEFSVVRTLTTTAANGEIAQAPASVEALHEWENYTVEVWGDTGGSGRDITSAVFDFAYNTALTTAVAIEAGPGFTLDSETIDDALGLVEGITLSANEPGLGDDQLVLLARINFEPRGDDQAEVDEVNHVQGPYDLGFGLADAEVTIEAIASPPTLGNAPDTSMWAVPYDVNDDNKINLGDFALFVPAFNRTTGGQEPPYTWWADFDGSGMVDFGDFAFFVPNFTKERGNGGIVLPPAFPAAGLLSGGEGELGGADFSVFDTETGRALMATLHAQGPYQNGRMHLDVDNDGQTTPHDALRVINVLNGATPTTVFLDVNGDKHVTPLDALQVINALNRLGGGEPVAEGELAAGASRIDFVQAGPLQSFEISQGETTFQFGRQARWENGAGGNATDAISNALVRPYRQDADGSVGDRVRTTAQDRSGLDFEDLDAAIDLIAEDVDKLLANNAG